MEPLKNIIIHYIIKNYNKYQKILWQLPNDLRYPINFGYFLFIESKQGIYFDVSFYDSIMYISNGEQYLFYKCIMHRAMRINIRDNKHKLYYITISHFGNSDCLYLVEYYSYIKCHQRAIVKGNDKLIELCKQFNNNPFIEKLIKINKKELL